MYFVRVQKIQPTTVGKIGGLIPPRIQPTNRRETRIELMHGTNLNIVLSNHRYYYQDGSETDFPVVKCKYKDLTLLKIYFLKSLVQE